MQHGCIILAEDPRGFIEIAGITVLERLLRTVERCGIECAIVATSSGQSLLEHVPARSSARPNLEISVREAGDATTLLPKSAEFFLVLRGDAIFDARLLGELLRRGRPTVLIDSSNATKECGAALVARAEITRLSLDLLTRRDAEVIDVAQLSSYSPAHRRDVALFHLAGEALTNREAVEEILISSTQKGAQDFPAMIHAPIEKFLVRRIAKTPITPHLLTICWILLAFVATGCFATGRVGAGVALAFVVGLLDGLDGKLARLRVETSTVGKLEHRFDSLFEVGWPVVLAWYFWRTGQQPNAPCYLLLLIAAQIADGLAKGSIYHSFATLRRPPNTFDRVVRFFGGRRNVFVWIILVCLLAGIEEKAVVVIAWWQAATALLDVPHALWLRSRAGSRGLSC